MNLAENEFELLSPTIKMLYQLWDLLPLETNLKGKQKNGNWNGFKCLFRKKLSK